MKLGCFAIILAHLLQQLLIQDCNGGNAQFRLLKALLNSSNYSIYDRPVSDENEPLNVNILFYLLQLIDLNEKDGFLKASIWIYQQWQAYNLKWNPEDYEGIQDIRADVRSIWRPDILLFNSADEKFDGSWPVNAVIKNTGIVEYTPPAMIKCACSIDIRWFPFDQQSCTLIYGSWTYSASFVNLKVLESKAYIDNYTKMFQHRFYQILSVIINHSSTMIDSTVSIRLTTRVTENTAKSFDDFYMYEDKMYSQVKLNITVQRRSLYYYFNLILPCAIISVMALLVFSLPVDSGEKMGLSVTILLSLAVFMMTISDKLPRSSDSISQIGLYLIVMMILCSISVMLSVWVLNLHYYPDLDNAPPGWIRYGVCIWLARFLCMKIPDDLKQHAEFLRKQERELKHMPNSSSKSLIANVLDLNDEFVHMSDLSPSPLHRGGGYGDRFPGSSFDEEQQPNQRFETSFGGPPDPTVGDSGFNPDTGERPCDAGIDSGGSTDRHCCQYRTQMKYILRELQCLSNKVQGDDKKDAIKNEWRFAARVIDRICLYIFAILVVSLTLAILLSPPYHWKSLYPPDAPLE